MPAVFINHGYGVKNTEYSFIAKALAAQGYYVVSIQHDLDGDPKFPTTGNLYQKRMPFWERGIKSLRLVMNSLSKTDPKLDMSKVILIGNSNGGDISMMFADKYPSRIKKIISLDSFRYPFPKNANILSLRANDTTADEGVLPSSGAKIITMNDAKHVDMSDKGQNNIKLQIVDYISKYLKEHSLFKASRNYN